MVRGKGNYLNTLSISYSNIEISSYGYCIPASNKFKYFPIINAEWIAKILCYGLIKKVLSPPIDLCKPRDLTWLRKKWIGNLPAEKNRISKVLVCPNIKLGSVISNIFGVLERKLLNRLVEKSLSIKLMSIIISIILFVKRPILFPRTLKKSILYSKAVQLSC